MKINLRKLKQNHGIALIITVVIFAVIALYFATYLIMASGERSIVARSQQWNDALTVAEAGVEEGLAFVNQYAYSTTPITNWSFNATADGWANIATTTSGQVTYQTFFKTLTLPNDGGFYSVYVTNVFTNFSGNIAYGAPSILSIGTAMTAANPNVSRTIFVQTSAITQSGGGVVAQEGVTESGNVEVDSWDSSTNIHSIWQTGSAFRRNYFNPNGIQYGIWSNTLSYISNSYVTLGIPSRTADVHVFSESNTVSVGGSATIAGYLQTGPNQIASVSGSATVGDLPWCFTSSGGQNQTGLQPGHWQEDANMNFYSYPLPVPTNTWQTTWIMLTNLPLTGTEIINIGGMWTNSAGVWSQVGGTLYTNKSGSGLNIGGVPYHYVITNRLENTNWVYYEFPNGSFGANLFIDAQYVVLYLPAGMNLTTSVITLNTNADIQIWSGSDIKTTGQSIINNGANYTHALAIYDIAGHPITVDLHGQSQPTGYYYLPSSTLEFEGGGDFVGAIICYSINDKGGSNIHFDESLKSYIPPDLFIPSTWTEIAPN